MAVDRSPELVLAIALPTTPSSASQARVAVSRAFAGIPDGSLEDAQLLVSEAVSEAVRSSDRTAEEPLHLSGYLDGTRLRIELAQDGRPRLEQPDESHLGLRILDAVATRWGQDHEGSGSTTWFELDAAAS